MTPNPTSYARSAASSRRRKARFLLLVILGLGLLLMALAIGSLFAGISGSALLIIALLIEIASERLSRRADRYFDDAHHFEKGAEAEEQAAAILAGDSPDRYHIINDVPCPYGNIDHVVISREGGVFAIETKSTHGTIDSTGDSLLVNGSVPERDPIRQVRPNAMWLKDTLGRVTGKKPYVTAVVFFPHAYVNVRKPVQGVVISSAPFLPRVLKQLPHFTSHQDLLWSLRSEVTASLVNNHPGLNHSGT